MHWDYCIGTYSSERSGREKNSTIYSIIKRPSSPPLPLFEFLTKSLASQKPTNSLDRQKRNIQKGWIGYYQLFFIMLKHSILQYLKRASVFQIHRKKCLWRISDYLSVNHGE